MNCKPFLPTLYTALLAASAAHAQTTLVVSDGFSYASGSITGKSGGTGWANNWTSSSSTAPNQVTSGGLTFTTAGSTLAASGGKLMTVGGDVGAYRRPPTAFGSYGGDVNQTVWISFLAANTAASTTSYAGLSLYADDSSPEKFFVGQINNSGQYGFVDSAPGSSTTAPFLTNVATDTSTHFLVACLDFSASGSTEFSLYVDPTPGVEPTDDPQALEDYTSSFQFNQFRFQSGTAYNFDEVRMGSTYLDVAPAAAPEPGSLAAFGIGVCLLGGMIRACRRHRAC